LRKAVFLLSPLAGRKRIVPEKKAGAKASEVEREKTFFQGSQYTDRKSLGSMEKVGGEK